jgi:hypothetical protein
MVLPISVDYGDYLKFGDFTACRDSDRWFSINVPGCEFERFPPNTGFLETSTNELRCYKRNGMEAA